MGIGPHFWLHLCFVIGYWLEGCVVEIEKRFWRQLHLFVVQVVNYLLVSGRLQADQSVISDTRRHPDVCIARAKSMSAGGNTSSVARYRKSRLKARKSCDPRFPTRRLFGLRASDSDGLVPLRAFCNHVCAEAYRLLALAKLISFSCKRTSRLETHRVVFNKICSQCKMPRPRGL